MFERDSIQRSVPTYDYEIGAYALFVILVLTASLLVISFHFAPSAAAYTTPPTTTSRYECWVDSATMTSQAQTQAGNGRSGIDILDWGRPGYNSGTGYVDFCAHFWTRAQVLGAAKTYAYQWNAASSSGHSMGVAIGTYNGCLLYEDQCAGGPGCTTSSCSWEASDYTQWGLEMAQDINSFQSYVSANAPKATAQAAIDAEPAWDNEPGRPMGNDTRQLLAGYNGTALEVMWDYGSAESGYWDDNLIGDVAFGINAAAGGRIDYMWDYAVPEVYYNSMATNFERVDCYEHTNGVGMFISGVMTEQPTSGTLTYSQAYNAMSNAVNATGGWPVCTGGSTAQSAIQYSTNI
jgi:hypothetical protein